MPSKRKENIAFEQKRMNKPQTLQKVLSCIRGYGQPMPLVKLAPVYAKKYGRNSPTIQQVFGCSALELLEGPELAPFVRVTYNTTQRQYFVAPIKNVKDKITKAQTKKQPAQCPKIKERTLNAFVEPQPKPALSLEKTLITIIDLVLQSKTNCVQLSEVPRLFKQKTGVDLNFKEKFGTSALKVMERPPLSDHLSVIIGTSTQHWVTLGRNKMLIAVVDLLREMGSDWVHLLALLNRYKQKTGIALNFPKMFGQSALDVITSHLSDEIFVEERTRFQHWLALKPEESSDRETESESDESELDELETQLWDFDIRPSGEYESESERSDSETGSEDSFCQSECGFTETEDEAEENLEPVIDLTSRIMLDAFAQRPPPRKALKALCARTTKLVCRMSLSE